ncbi:MAG: hypothetical protein HYZ28_23105 [Myxococcales bacterium]|nr:hypothetical protein [Myxococcales bacterium]
MLLFAAAALAPAAGAATLEEEKAQLAAERKALDAEKSAVASRVADFNSRCGDSPEASCRSARGEVEAAQSALNRRIDDWTRRRDEFRARSTEAQGVKAQQDEFDRANDAWRRKQAELIRQSVEYNRRWASAVRDSLAAEEPAPVPAKSYADLRPGDVILVAPEYGSRSSEWIRRLDNWSRGRKGATETPASHALVFLGRDAGRRLQFLDHVPGGSRILGETEFRQTYERRGMDVAAVAIPLDRQQGTELFRAASDAVKNTKKKGLLSLVDRSDYGLFDQAVCSERAGWVVSRATKRKMEGANRWFVDISPGDFYDPEYGGKHFVVSPLSPSSSRP